LTFPGIADCSCFGAAVPAAYDNLLVHQSSSSPIHRYTPPPPKFLSLSKGADERLTRMLDMSRDIRRPRYFVCGSRPMLTVYSTAGCEQSYFSAKALASNVAAKLGTAMLSVVSSFWGSADPDPRMAKQKGSGAGVSAAAAAQGGAAKERATALRYATPHTKSSVMRLSFPPPFPCNVYVGGVSTRTNRDPVCGGPRFILTARRLPAAV
jgi:hypothetical protein